jgi:hypothetical protein
MGLILGHDRKARLRPHPCRAIVPFFRDDGESGFHTPSLPLATSPTPPSRYAPSPMRSASTFRLPHSQFHIPYLPSLTPYMVRKPYLVFLCFLFRPSICSSISNIIIFSITYNNVFTVALSGTVFVIY